MQATEFNGQILRKVKMVKAVLIDLDGTLVDSTPALYQVYLKFLEHYGHKGNKEEFNSLVGPSIDEIVSTLKTQYKLEDDNEKLANMYVSFIMLQGFEGTELFTGVREFLDYAKEKGLKLAIVTSGTHALVKTCLDPFGIYERFDAILTSEDVKQAKPFPEIYELALSKLKVPAEEAVAIEDSTVGAASAKGAGLPVLFITHGKSVEGIEAYQAVNNWKECLEYVDKTSSV
ncbi:Pyrophosphatase PpaX [Chlamydiales bacterium STE3]|nr:Pyrophosphatase PpaX [Chlamydiales bacterium STE3]